MSNLPNIDSSLTEHSTDNSNIEAGTKPSVVNNPLDAPQNQKLSVSSDEYNLQVHQGTLNESITETLVSNNNFNKLRQEIFGVFL